MGYESVTCDLNHETYWEQIVAVLTADSLFAISLDFVLTSVRGLWLNVLLGGSLINVNFKGEKICIKISQEKLKQ